MYLTQLMVHICYVSTEKSPSCVVMIECKQCITLPWTGLSLRTMWKSRCAYSPLKEAVGGGEKID